MIPIITLTGQAGSGKDTVSDILAKLTEGTVISFADPLKRMTQTLFEFSDEQLWGASINRNKTHHGLDKKFWWDANQNVFSPDFEYEVKQVFEHKTDEVIAKTSGLFLKKLENEFKNSLTPRIALQRLGTELGRSISPNAWANYAKKVSLSLLGGEYKYTRTDGPFYSVDTKPASFIIVSDARFVNEIVTMASVGSSIWKIARETGYKDTHSSETESEKINPLLIDIFINNNKAIDDLTSKVRMAYEEVFGCKKIRIF